MFIKVTIDRGCGAEVPVRLNGANIEYGGRVEVFYNGKWGKICRNKWNFEDVKVICRQLGFIRAVAEFVMADVKDEDIPFVMSNVACNGDEPELASCPRTDGKLNVDCQSDDKGAQALCEPKKDKKILDASREFLDVGSREIIRCFLKNETNHIRWFNNKHQEINSTSGTRMTAKQNGELTIENVQLSDGGTYECRGLEYTRYYTIYVNARFTEVNHQQSIIADASGIISCSAEGTPTPQIEWKRKDGVQLDKARFRQLLNGSLYVNPVHRQDEGTYICTFKQSKGSKRATIKNQTINVFITIRPIVELLGPRKPLQEGDSANLTCNIIEGLPEPRLSFFKNEPDLPSKEITSPLLLTNVTDSDEGRYICEARNAGGNFTDSIYIRVKTPPELNPKLGNQSVAFNSTLNLTCIVRGDPPLQINWTRNGVDLGNRDNNTYTVSQMTFDHAGLYGCTAKNWAGKAYAFFWIDVTVSPQIYVSPRNKSVPEGHPENFSCKATGVPKPTFSWKFNDGYLPSGISQASLSEGSFLELPYTTKRMEGIYKCTAENKANTTTSSAYLHVFEKPTAEVSPKPYPKLTVGDELRLTCRINKATVAIKWKKNDDELIPRAQIDTRVDDKLSQLFIVEVEEGDRGEYSCEARNRPGIVARSTVKINVKGKDDYY